MTHLPTISAFYQNGQRRLTLSLWVALVCLRQLARHSLEPSSNKMMVIQAVGGLRGSTEVLVSFPELGPG